MIERRYFDNRRDLERRQNSAAAIAFHFQECARASLAHERQSERRVAERRATDNQAICAWLSIFHETRSEKGI